MNDDNVIYFQIFGVEHIPKEIKKLIHNKLITTNIFKVLIYDSLMFGSFCTGFFNFLLKGATFKKYKNLSSPNEYEKNDKTTLKYLQ